MCSSVADDSYYYEKYDLGWYEEYAGPPIIHKKSRLLAAVVQNQVGILEDLLDSPEWYNVTDYFGLTLLQIAILTDNKEVFDYMMSIPDFPIDYVGNEGDTALHIALQGFVCNGIGMSQHFAYELVKKGASINIVCSDGNTPLHCALERSYNKVATLLIQKGVDVNVFNDEGWTPLDVALQMYKGVDEVVTALLIYGATPSADSIVENETFSVQEQLFLYIFDKSSEVDIHLHIILKLAERKSLLFHELLKYPFRVIISENVYPYFCILCSMEKDYLRIVIEKFSNHIKEAFAKIGFEHVLPMPDLDRVDFIENLDLMLESDLRSDVISIISATQSVDLFKNKFTSVKSKCNPTELYCYLLSYGLNISEWDLHNTYKCFGHNELFKILLHMDVKMNVEDKTRKYPMAVLLYNVTIDVDQCFQQRDRYIWNTASINELSSYFVHPKLKERYSHLVHTKEIPLLTELARNVFRKYFIEFFRIKTSRKFYTVLNCLPISLVHKKIISYGTKLYVNNL